MNKERDIQYYINTIEFLYLLFFDDNNDKFLTNIDDRKKLFLLNTMEKMFEEDIYAVLLTESNLMNLNNFVSDCRFTIKNITKKQFLLCDNLMKKIQEQIICVQKFNASALEIGKKYAIKPKEKNYQLCNLATKYFSKFIVASSIIDDELLIERYDIVSVYQSIQKEYFLFLLLDGASKGFILPTQEVEILKNLITSPATFQALVRIVNQLKPLEEDMRSYLISIVIAMDQYIKEGYTEIIVHDKEYLLEKEKDNSMEDQMILESDATTRLLCYLKNQKYEGKNISLIKRFRER